MDADMLPLQEKGRNPADHISPYPDIASDTCQEYNIKL